MIDIYTDPKSPPISEFDAKFLSAENSRKNIRLAEFAVEFLSAKKNTNIQIIK